MTESTPMNREELLELAALDALGLLTEYEAALYTRSFHYATATVQNEVLALQAIIASDETLLPNEEPPADLRRRVLEHVAAVIERESPTHAPLATIGQRRSAGVEGPRGEVAERHRAAGVHAVVARQFWRAATFVLCGAIVVVAWFAADVNRKSHDLARLVFSDHTAVQIEREIGPTFKQFLFNPATTFIHLQATDAESGVRAVVGLVEGEPLAILVVEGLAWEDGYELRLVDSNNRTHRVTTFDVSHQLAGYAIDIPVGAALGPNARWEIAYKGDVILATA